MSFNKVKTMIKEEFVAAVGDDQVVTPILHNDGMIILQFCGWSINLNSDGSWYWEATDGG